MKISGLFLKNSARGSTADKPLGRLIGNEDNFTWKNSKSNFMVHQNNDQEGAKKIWPGVLPFIYKTKNLSKKIKKNLTPKKSTTKITKI